MLLEKLESRLLLSSVTYENQILSITGSPRRDRIRINIVIDTTGGYARVLINGHGGYVPDFWWVEDPMPKQVLVRSGKGNDTIRIFNFQGVPMTIRAGAGNDVINGITGAATIFAGRGDDVVSGASSGNPSITVFGADGNDHITGSAADVELHGGSGNDTLISDEGHDQLFGDEGNDVLKGGEGSDTYMGGGGNDRIFSADGNDNESVDGGAGKDTVYADQDCSSAPHLRDRLISIEQGVCA